MPTCRDCADHDRICPTGGQPCDPDDIIVEMRSGEAPFKTWRELGHIPFELFGERFAVTLNVAVLNGPARWRVTHVSTGAAIPHSASGTQQGAKDAAIAVLMANGEEKFKRALVMAREAIACGE